MSSIQTCTIFFEVVTRATLRAWTTTFRTRTTIATLRTWTTIATCRALRLYVSFGFLLQFAS
jgi:hypothetical protein